MMFGQRISNIEIIFKHTFLNSGKESLTKIENLTNTNGVIGKT
jgi:hypothetical protein